MNGCRNRWKTLAIAGSAVFALALGPSAMGQGFIVDRRPEIPVGRSYEIREVSIDARVRDQVAEVQISQTFHNPGSFPIESGVPLPAARGRGDPELRAPGRRPGAARPADEQGRGAADLRGDRPLPARPGAAGIHGPGALSHQRVPDPSGADRKVTMRYTQLCKRRTRRPRVHLSARHAEVHGQADPAAGGECLDPEQGCDQVGLLPDR